MSPPSGDDAIERLGHRTERFPLFRRRTPQDTLPLTLTRRRIYVLPTGFGLLVSTVLLAMLMGALNYNNNPGLFLAFVLVAIAHNGLLQAHLTLSGLSVLGLQADPVHAGETAQVRLRLHGGERARWRLEWHWLGGDALIDLQPGTEAEVRIPLPTTRRGWQPLPRLRVSTVQPLGLARAWSWLRPSATVLVYPQPEATLAPLPQSPAGGNDARRHQPEGDEPHHLREYQRGDAPRQIAWKASARSNELLVKRYQAGQPKEWVLDWDHTGLAGREARIARLARWVLEAERLAQPYRLRLPGVELGPARGPAHQHACLRALAELPHG